MLLSRSRTKFVVFGPIGKPRWPPDLWLAETFSTSPLKPLNGIERNLTGSKISTSSTKFVFFGPIGKPRWLPRLLIGRNIFNFSSETAEQNSTKLFRKEDLNVLYQVCVFRADRKTNMAARPLMVDASETTERNLMKLDSNQELNVLYQIRVFQADWKTKMAARNLIGWYIFNFSSETAERKITKLYMKQDPNVLYKFVFFGPIGKPKWLPGLRLA